MRVKVCPVCGSEFGDEAAFCSRDRSPLRPADAGSAPGLVGQLVGDRYQVERRIGEGGMGEVYLARHVLMGRSCALKVLSPSVSQDPDAVTRFNREATNASRISHPNVCAVYDFGLTSDGLVYLAMEYVEGRTLSAVLEEQGAMPVSRAVELTAQCAAGLQAAHDLGIVHRDLKPDNVMVSGPRERETAKLVDFGIAKAMVAEPLQRVTRSGFVVGTPDYMSPEQLSGDPVDARSDQYSLALVFYRLVTGKLPFEGESAQETLTKRLTDPPRPLAAARPGARFPVGLQGVLDRGLARRPQDRYPTVTAFVEALHGAGAGDAAPTRRLDAPGARGGEIPPTRLAPARRPHRGARMVAAVTAIVVVGGGAWEVMRLRRPGTVAPPPAPPVRVVADTVAQPALSAAPPPSPPTTAVRPAGVPVGRDSSRTAGPGGGDTLAVPEPDVLDSPSRRPLAVMLARRILDGRRQPPHKRARAAALLGHDAVMRNDRKAALGFYQQAYALFPDSKWLSMIRQLQDTTQP
jgi:eukaryotic-like serine/threonine-protein kinase